MREALPASDPNYGSVREIDGKLYVGGAGPEAKKAQAREDARALQRAEQEARAEAERARVAEAQERYGPALEAWPAVRAELTRRREDAEERLRVALVESPVFSALMDVVAAQRAADLGGRAIGSMRSEITGQPFYVSSVPPRSLDLSEVVRLMGEEVGPGVLEEARATVAAPVGDGG